VRRFAVEHELFAPGDRVLAGVSGGPDSTCLLLVLAALRRSLGIELRAAYFDHGLRGARAGERERNAVQRLAGALELPLHTGSGDVKAHARRHKRSIEEAARELRYRFLAQAARRAGCDIVVVGHTRDDQAETVLLRLLRGSGLRGLAAMAADAPWPLPARGRTPRLVRPLLALTRDETAACCRAAGVTPVADPSNRSPAHLRNRVRRELLPQLRRYNPRIDEALTRLAASAASDIALLETLAAEAVEPTSGGARIDRARFRALPASLQQHAVRLAARRASGDGRDLSERHVRAVVRAAAGPTGARLDLPRGLRVAVRRDTLVFGSGDEAAPPLPDRPVALTVPGRARAGGWRLEADIVRRPAQLALEGGVYLDVDACGEALSVRRRRPGDRFQPLGMRQSKKLQDVLVDGHVGREERDGLPLVCAGRRIAWVAGGPPAEWAKVGPRARRAVRVTARRA